MSGGFNISFLRWGGRLMLRQSAIIVIPKFVRACPIPAQVEIVPLIPAAIAFHLIG
jgi:hypothetical protein